MTVTTFGDTAAIRAHEDLSTAWRRGQLGGFETISSFAACLIPLLTALDWRGDPRRLAEALPHFASSIDLVGFRNVLADLGYATRKHSERLHRIDPRAMPCLFVPRHGAPMVVLREELEGIRVFDSSKVRERTVTDRSLRGEVYFIESEITGASAAREPVDNWLGGIARRFRGLVVHLFGLTFAMNLLALAVPFFIMTVYDKVIMSGSTELLSHLVVGVLLALFCDLGFRVLRARILSYIGARVDNLVGTAALKQILELPANFTETAPIGNQISRIREFESVREFFTGPMATVVLALPFVLLFVGVIAMVAGPVALVPAILIMMFVVLGLIIFPVMRARVSESSRSRSKRQSLLVEMLSKVRAIHQCSAGDVWLDRFREMSAEATYTGFRAAQISFLVQTISHVLMVLAGILTIGLGTLRVMDGDMTVGGLIATMALVWRVLSPLQLGFVTLTRVEQVRLGLKQMNQLMRMVTEHSSVHTMRRTFQGRIAFHRVSFRYQGTTDPALLGVNFEVEPGDFVAVIGPNGCGKSTILKLIAGLYRPQAGMVAVDGIDIRQLDPIELRQNIGYLPQSCSLFHGTVAQNLRLANPNASEEDLRQACEEVGVLKDIEGLEDGFDTRIGDQQLQQLPSGFQQRLALARAMVTKAPIILLDEPGQALDDEGEAAFMNVLKSMRGKKTIFLVTYRPSHMRLADRMLVLDAGQVTLDGEPEQVLAKIPKGAL